MLTRDTGHRCATRLSGMQRARGRYPAPASPRHSGSRMSLLVTFISVSAEEGLRGAAAIAVRAASRVVRGTGATRVAPRRGTSPCAARPMRSHARPPRCCICVMARAPVWLFQWLRGCLRKRSQGRKTLACRFRIRIQILAQRMRRAVIPASVGTHVQHQKLPRQPHALPQILSSPRASACSSASIRWMSASPTLPRRGTWPPHRTISVNSVKPLLKPEQQRRFLPA